MWHLESWLSSRKSLYPSCMKWWVGGGRRSFVLKVNKQLRLWLRGSSQKKKKEQNEHECSRGLRCDVMWCDAMDIEREREDSGWGVWGTCIKTTTCKWHFESIKSQTQSTHKTKHIHRVRLISFDNLSSWVLEVRSSFPSLSLFRSHAVRIWHLVIIYYCTYLFIIGI